MLTESRTESGAYVRTLVPRLSGVSYFFRGVLDHIVFKKKNRNMPKMDQENWCQWDSAKSTEIYQKWSYTVMSQLTNGLFYKENILILGMGLCMSYILKIKGKVHRLKCLKKIWRFLLIEKIILQKAATVRVTSGEPARERLCPSICPSVRPSVRSFRLYVNAALTEEPSNVKDEKSQERERPTHPCVYNYNDGITHKATDKLFPLGSFFHRFALRESIAMLGHIKLEQPSFYCQYAASPVPEHTSMMNNMHSPVQSTQLLGKTGINMNNTGEGGKPCEARALDALPGQDHVARPLIAQHPRQSLSHGYVSSTTVGSVPNYFQDHGTSPTQVKYVENGNDTFSDFVTLVCQEAQNADNSQSRSPFKLQNSYYNSNMLPHQPTPLIARPVPIIKSTADFLDYQKNDSPCPGSPLNVDNSSTSQVISPKQQSVPQSPPLVTSAPQLINYVPMSCSMSTQGNTSSGGTLLNSSGGMRNISSGVITTNSRNAITVASPRWHSGLDTLTEAMDYTAMSTLMPHLTHDSGSSDVIHLGSERYYSGVAQNASSDTATRDTTVAENVGHNISLATLQSHNSSLSLQENNITISSKSQHS
ncbi:unnamed protein product, partial [Meganyctiphanes norvegica]